MIKIDIDSGKFAEKITETVKKQITNAINELGALGTAQAKALAPVDTGALRSSIHQTETKVSNTEVTGGWATNSEYAVYNEFGTGQRGMSNATRNGLDKSPESVSYTEDWEGMYASPFMYPSAVLVAEKTPEIMKKHLKGG